MPKKSNVGRSSRTRRTRGGDVDPNTRATSKKKTATGDSEKHPQQAGALLQSNPPLSHGVTAVVSSSSSSFPTHDTTLGATEVQHLPDNNGSAGASPGRSSRTTTTTATTTGKPAAANAITTALLSLHAPEIIWRHHIHPATTTTTSTSSKEFLKSGTRRRQKAEYPTDTQWESVGIPITTKASAKVTTIRVSVTFKIGNGGRGNKSRGFVIHHCHCFVVQHCHHCVLLSLFIIVYHCLHCIVYCYWILLLLL